MYIIFIGLQEVFTFPFFMVTLSVLQRGTLRGAVHSPIISPAKLKIVRFPYISFYDVGHCVDVGF